MSLGGGDPAPGRGVALRSPGRAAFEVPAAPAQPLAPAPAPAPALPAPRAGGGGGPGAPEAVDVLRALAGMTKGNVMGPRDVFAHFDTDGDGEWDRAELYEMVRALEPDASLKCRFRLIDTLAACLDARGHGRVSYSDFKRGLMLLGTPVSPIASVRSLRDLDSGRPRSRLVMTNISNRDVASGGARAKEGAASAANAGPPPAPAPPGSRAASKSKVFRRLSSSLLLGDALVEAGMDMKITTENTALPSALDAAAHVPQGAPGAKQHFLSSNSCQLKLMLQQNIAAGLEDLFNIVYSDNSQFYEVNKSEADIDLSVSKWQRNSSYEGCLRIIRMQTRHPRLGLLNTQDIQRYAWGPNRRWMIVEHRNMTPTLPHGSQWRVEKRCTFVELQSGVSQVVIAAAVHVESPFPEADKLKEAVESTLKEDAHTYFQAVMDTLLTVHKVKPRT